ncbi:membrane protein [Streptomyces globisporus]|uniref:membrane protein n=1 Tax=Streptomyces globisporus TaxID=1908 RepID=UPI0004CA3EEC|nr:membrane protein [Streptomyces globisporus]
MTTEEEEKTTAAARSVRRAVVGRLSWGLADQAASSMSNFVVGFYVARSLGVTAFGVFSLAWVTYGVVLGASRGLATDPLVVRFSGVSHTAWRGAAARSTGAALTVGAAVGAVCLLIGLALGGGVGAAFACLGVVLPGLLLQDAWRFAFFAAGAGRKAFVNDLVWGAALVPALVVAARVDSVAAFVLAWGASAAVAAAYGLLQSGVRPRTAEARGWLREQRDLGYRYLVENGSLSGAGQLRSYGLGVIVGVGAVGAVRGAELLLGPFLALLMGLSLVTVAEAARVLRRAPHRLGGFCLLLGGGQAVAALLWGAALLLVPDRLGEFVLGGVWPSASELIVPAALGVAGAGLGTGAAAGLRALGAARRSLRAQLFASACYVVGGLGGAVVAGTVGSAWGVAAATAAGSAVWWLQLRSALRERHRNSIPEVRTS